MPPCGSCHSALHGWAVRPCSQRQCSPGKVLDGVAGPWSGRWWERPSLCYPGPAFGAPYSCSMVVMELLRHNDDVVAEPNHIAFPGPLDHVLQLPLQHQVSRMPPAKLVQQYHPLQFQPVEGPIDRLP